MPKTGETAPMRQARLEVKNRNLQAIEMIRDDFNPGQTKAQLKEKLFRIQQRMRGDNAGGAYGGKK